MSWLPHDLGTWGFIISVVALLLTIPLGIVATILAPKAQVWWFMRSVRGTANKLRYLTDLRQQLKDEPVFTPTETLIFEQTNRLMLAVHFLAGVVGFAVLATWRHPFSLQPQTYHPSSSEHLKIYLHIAPFLVAFMCSLIYFHARALTVLLRCSPKEREKVDRQIRKLLRKLNNKNPPA